MAYMAVAQVGRSGSTMIIDGCHGAGAYTNMLLAKYVPVPQCVWRMPGGGVVNPSMHHR